MQFLTPEKPIDISIEKLIVAGWTGRDVNAVDHHIKELAELGIAPPSAVPLFYRVSNQLAVHSKTIQVLGNSTSGEVEPLLIEAEGQWWLGLASDHTDRELEAHSVAASKQACAKPISRTLWPLQRVANYLDDLTMTCRIWENNTWVSYQEGSLASILPLAQLLEQSAAGQNHAMLCGTLGAIGSIRPAEHYQMELTDPVLGEKITLEYAVQTLPIVA